MPIAPQTSRQSLPRLSIGHLLLLTLSCSICLAVIAPSVNRIWNTPDDQFRGSKFGAIAVPILDNLAHGLKLFGLAVLAWQRLRFGPLNPSPGHWYFLIAGGIAFAFLISELMPIPAPARSSALYDVLSAILYFGAALLGVRALAAIDTWPWRVCLGLFTASLLTFTFLFAYRAAEIAGYTGWTYRLHVIVIWSNFWLAFALAAIVAVAIDLAAGRRRDWLHYFALLAILLSATSVLYSFGAINANWWADFYHLVTG